MSGRPVVLAVVPARGGSRGVPGKNVALVGGQPLVARAVRAAAGSRYVDHVAVSTDDAAIAAAAAAAGAEVVTRPAELSGDTATSESALLHAIDAVTERLGTAPDVVVLVQCTSPFVTAADIDQVAAAVVDGGADSALTVGEFHGFVWRPDGSGVNHDPAARLRRQDRPRELLETGAAYAMTVAGLREHGHRFFGRVEPVVVDAGRTLEVDDPQHLELAQAMAASLDPVVVSRPTRSDVDAVVLDFDGTQTDDRVYVDQRGRESVAVHRGDGLGVAALRRAGVPVLVLSTEVNPVVAARGRKLQVPVLQGIAAKDAALKEWADAAGVALERTVYVGNDVNDLPCFAIVGWPVAVADAHDAVRARARAVTTARGGSGAVREVATWLLGQGLDYGSDAPPLHR